MRSWPPGHLHQQRGEGEREQVQEKNRMGTGGQAAEAYTSRAALPLLADANICLFSSGSE